MAQVKFSYKGLKIKNKNFCNEDFNNSQTQFVCSEVGSYIPHDYGNQGDNTAGSVFDFFGGNTTINLSLATSCQNYGNVNDSYFVPIGENDIPGCMDSNAFNYNPDATSDDQSNPCSCYLEDCFGCTDELAFQYVQESFVSCEDGGPCVDDGSCIYISNPFSTNSLDNLDNGNIPQDDYITWPCISLTGMDKFPTHYFLDTDLDGTGCGLPEYFCPYEAGTYEGSWNIDDDYGYETNFVTEGGDTLCACPASTDVYNPKYQCYAFDGNSLEDSWIQADGTSSNCPHNAIMGPVLDGDSCGFCKNCEDGQEEFCDEIDYETELLTYCAQTNDTIESGTNYCSVVFQNAGTTDGLYKFRDGFLYVCEQDGPEAESWTGNVWTDAFAAWAQYDPEATQDYVDFVNDVGLTHTFIPCDKYPEDSPKPNQCRPALIGCTDESALNFQWQPVPAIDTGDLLNLCDYCLDATCGIQSDGSFCPNVPDASRCDYGCGEGVPDVTQTCCQDSWAKSDANALEYEGPLGYNGVWNGTNSRCDWVSGNAPTESPNPAGGRILKQICLHEGPYANHPHLAQTGKTTGGYYFQDNPNPVCWELDTNFENVDRRYIDYGGGSRDVYACQSAAGTVSEYYWESGPLVDDAQPFVIIQPKNPYAIDGNGSNDFLALHWPAYCDFGCGMNAGGALDDPNYFKNSVLEECCADINNDYVCDDSNMNILICRTWGPATTNDDYWYPWSSSCMNMDLTGISSGTFDGENISSDTMNGLDWMYTEDNEHDDWIPSDPDFAIGRVEGCADPTALNYFVQDVCTLPENEGGCGGYCGVQLFPDEAASGDLAVMCPNTPVAGQCDYGCGKGVGEEIWSGWQSTDNRIIIDVPDFLYLPEFGDVYTDWDLQYNHPYGVSNTVPADSLWTNVKWCTDGYYDGSNSTYYRNYAYNTDDETVMAFPLCTTGLTPTDPEFSDGLYPENLGVKEDYWGERMVGYTLQPDETYERPGHLFQSAGSTCTSTWNNMYPFNNINCAIDYLSDQSCSVPTERVLRYFKDGSLRVPDYGYSLGDGFINANYYWVNFANWGIVSGCMDVMANNYSYQNPASLCPDGESGNQIAIDSEGNQYDECPIFPTNTCDYGCGDGIGNSHTDTFNNHTIKCCLNVSPDNTTVMENLWFEYNNNVPQDDTCGDYDYNIQAITPIGERKEARICTSTGPNMCTNNTFNIFGNTDNEYDSLNEPDVQVIAIDGGYDTMCSPQSHYLYTPADGGCPALNTSAEGLTTGYGHLGEWLASLMRPSKTFGCTDPDGRVALCTDDFGNPDAGEYAEIHWKLYCNWGCGSFQRSRTMGMGAPIQNITEFNETALFYCAKDSGVDDEGNLPIENDWDHPYWPAGPNNKYLDLNWDTYSDSTHGSGAVPVCRYLGEYAYNNSDYTVVEYEWESYNNENWCKDCESMSTFNGNYVSKDICVNMPGDPNIEMLSTSGFTEYDCNTIDMGTFMPRYLEVEGCTDTVAINYEEQDECSDCPTGQCGDNGIGPNGGYEGDGECPTIHNGNFFIAPDTSHPSIPDVTTQGSCQYAGCHDRNAINWNFGPNARTVEWSADPSITAQKQRYIRTSGCANDEDTEAINTNFGCCEYQCGRPGMFYGGEYNGGTGTLFDVETGPIWWINNDNQWLQTDTWMWLSNTWVSGIDTSDRGQIEYKYCKPWEICWDKTDLSISTEGEWYRRTLMAPTTFDPANDNYYGDLEIYSWSESFEDYATINWLGDSEQFMWSNNVNYCEYNFGDCRGAKNGRPIDMSNWCTNVEGNIEEGGGDFQDKIFAKENNWMHLYAPGSDESPSWSKPAIFTCTNPEALNYVCYTKSLINQPLLDDHIFGRWYSSDGGASINYNNDWDTNRCLYACDLQALGTAIAQDGSIPYWDSNVNSNNLWSNSGCYRVLDDGSYSFQHQFATKYHCEHWGFKWFDFITEADSCCAMAMFIKEGVDIPAEVYPSIEYTIDNLIEDYIQNHFDSKGIQLEVIGTIMDRENGFYSCSYEKDGLLQVLNNNYDTFFPYGPNLNIGAFKQDSINYMDDVNIGRGGYRVPDSLTFSNYLGDHLHTNGDGSSIGEIPLEQRQPDWSFVSGIGENNIPSEYLSSQCEFECGGPLNKQCEDPVWYTCSYIEDYGNRCIGIIDLEDIEIEVDEDNSINFDITVKDPESMLEMNRSEFLYDFEFKHRSGPDLGKILGNSLENSIITYSRPKWVWDGMPHRTQWYYNGAANIGYGQKTLLMSQENWYGDTILEDLMLYNIDRGLEYTAMTTYLEPVDGYYAFENEWHYLFDFRENPLPGIGGKERLYGESQKSFLYDFVTQNRPFDTWKPPQHTIRSIGQGQALPGGTQLGNFSICSEYRDDPSCWYLGGTNGDTYDLSWVYEDGEDLRANFICPFPEGENWPGTGENCIDGTMMVNDIDNGFTAGYVDYTYPLSYGAPCWDQSLAGEWKWNLNKYWTDWDQLEQEGRTCNGIDYSEWISQLCSTVSYDNLNNDGVISDFELKKIENVICPGDRLIIEQDNFPVISDTLALPCNNNTWDYLTEIEAILYTQRAMSEYYQGTAYSETTETYIQRVAQTVNTMIDSGEYGETEIGHLKVIGPESEIYTRRGGATTGCPDGCGPGEVCFEEESVCVPEDAILNPSWMNLGTFETQGGLELGSESMTRDGRLSAGSVGVGVHEVAPSEPTEAPVLSHWLDLGISPTGDNNEHDLLFNPDSSICSSQWSPSYNPSVGLGGYYDLYHIKMKRDTVNELKKRFKFKPYANMCGTAVYEYTVRRESSDANSYGIIREATAEITVTVNCVEDAPTFELGPVNYISDSNMSNPNEQWNFINNNSDGSNAPKFNGKITPPSLPIDTITTSTGTGRYISEVFGNIASEVQLSSGIDNLNTFEINQSFYLPREEYWLSGWFKVNVGEQEIGVLPNENHKVSLSIDTWPHTPIIETWLFPDDDSDGAPYDWSTNRTWYKVSSAKEELWPDDYFKTDYIPAPPDGWRNPIAEIDANNEYKYYDRYVCFSLDGANCPLCDEYAGGMPDQGITYDSPYYGQWQEHFNYNYDYLNPNPNMVYYDWMHICDAIDSPGECRGKIPYSACWDGEGWHITTGERAKVKFSISSTGVGPDPFNIGIYGLQLEQSETFNSSMDEGYSEYITTNEKGVILPDNFENEIPVNVLLDPYPVETDTDLNLTISPPNSEINVNTNADYYGNIFNTTNSNRLGIGENVSDFVALKEDIQLGNNNPALASQGLDFNIETPYERYNFSGVRFFNNTPGTIYSEYQPLSSCVYGDCVYIFSFWAKAVPQLKAPDLEYLPENMIDFNLNPIPIKPRYSYGGVEGTIHNEEKLHITTPNWMAEVLDTAIIQEYNLETLTWSTIHTHDYSENYDVSPSEGICNITGGWKRFSIAFAPNPALNQYTFNSNKNLFINYDSYLTTCDEDGYNPGTDVYLCKDLSIYVWGVQLEKRDIGGFGSGQLSSDLNFTPDEYTPKFGGDFTITHREEDE